MHSPGSICYFIHCCKKQSALKRSRCTVLLTIDQTYLVPATVTLFSLLENNPKQSFKIYLFSEESDPKWLTPLREIVEGRGSEIVLKRVTKDDFENIKINLHFSVAAYYRLLAADLIEEDRVLYLDSDTLILGDITPLWQVDLGEYPLAAVSDLIVRDFHRLDLQESHGYFNSGVMMLNLKIWRESDLGNKVLAYVFSNPEKIIYADQCGLNGFLNGNWLRLDLKWNLQASLFQKEYEDLISSWNEGFDLKAANQNPLIIHFSGPQKPWQLGSRHPYKKMYWKYLNQTPFARRFSEDFTIPNLLRMLIPLALKKYYWRYLINQKSKN